MQSGKVTFACCVAAIALGSCTRPGLALASDTRGINGEYKFVNGGDVRANLFIKNEKSYTVCSPDCHSGNMIVRRYLGIVTVDAYGTAMEDFLHVRGLEDKSNDKHERYIGGHVDRDIFGTPMIYFGLPDEDFFKRVKVSSGN